MHDKIQHTVKQYLLKNHPDLFQIHYPVLGRITKVYTEPKVDLQILKPDQGADEEVPEIPEVVVEDSFEVGDLVRVGFYYNDPNMPFVDRKVML